MNKGSLKLLYRGLRQKEIDLGGILYPKEVEVFKAEATFPLQFPITFGLNSTNATRNHQNGLPTRGVSTTTNLKIAKKYAGSGVVVVIDREGLENYAIQEYVVADVLHPSQVRFPEDEEVILVYERDGAFPAEVIIEMLTIHEK